MNPPRAILWIAVSSALQATDDKASLPAQEADLRARAAANGWHVVDVLRVPGHSRAYVDIHECAADMRAAGIDAFDRLIAHWKAADFDVLACRDGDRFGRKQTIFSYVVEKTIDMGGRLFTLSDGWIDDGNFRMAISMGGYKAATDVDQLVKRARFGMDARVKKGLPPHGNTFFAHRVVRDERGRAVATEVRPEARAVLDAAAALLLNGTPITQIGASLATLGYLNPRGKPYPALFWYRAFYNPALYGHAVRHWYAATGACGGLWALDARYEGMEPPPPGATILRDSLPACYPPDTLERIKAEIARRGVVRGRARSDTTNRYSGLCVCAECGAPFVYASRGKWLYCRTHAQRTATGRDCAAGSISEPAITGWLAAILPVVVEGRVPDDLMQDEADDTAGKLANTRAELTRTQSRIDRLIGVLADAPDSAVPDLAARLTELTNARAALQSTVRQLEAAAGLTDTPARDQARADIARVGTDSLLAGPPAACHQTLHAALGNLRLVVKDRAVVGFTRVR